MSCRIVIPRELHQISSTKDMKLRCLLTRPERRQDASGRSNGQNPAGVNMKEDVSEVRETPAARMKPCG